MGVKEVAIEHAREFIREWLNSLKNNPLLVDPIMKFILSEFQAFSKEELSVIVEIGEMKGFEDLLGIIDKISDLSELELIISGLVYSLAAGELKLSGTVGPITKGVILTSFKDLNKKIWKNVEISDKTLKGLLTYYIDYLVETGQINKDDIQILDAKEDEAKIKITNDPFVTAIKHVLRKLGDVDKSSICLRGLSFVAFVRTITDETMDIKVESYSDNECIIHLNFF